MVYATQADLETRLGEKETRELANRDNDNFIDDNVIDTAISDAENEVNSYLAVRYITPLTDVPDLIKRITCDIARYRLHKDSITEIVRLNYEDAVAMLKRLAAGTIKLPELVEPPTNSAYTVNSRVTVFTDETLAKLPI